MILYAIIYYGDGVDGNEKDIVFLARAETLDAAARMVNESHELQGGVVRRANIAYELGKWNSSKEEKSEVLLGPLHGYAFNHAHLPVLECDAHGEWTVRAE